MKISVVHSMYSSSNPSGENITVINQVLELRRAGYEVQFISRSSDQIDRKIQKLLSVGVSVLSGFGPSPLKEIKSFNPNIVHVHNTFPNFGTLWLNDLNKPIVITLHNFRPLCANGTLSLRGKTCRLCPQKSSLFALKYKCYHDSLIQSIPLAIATRGAGQHNLLIKNANKIIFLSERMQKEYFSYFQNVNDKSTVIPNFTTITDVPKKESPENYWVFVGRIDEAKGVLDLAKKWPVNKTLKIIGDGEDFSKLQNLKLPNIECLGKLPHLEVLRIIGNSKGLVFPSKWQEGLPTVFLEATSLGVPTLSYPENTVADYISAYGGGVLVKKDWGAAILEVENSWERLSSEAVKISRSHFRPESWIERISHTYKSIV